MHSVTVEAHETSDVPASGSVKLFGITPWIYVTVEGVHIGANADSGVEVSLVTEPWYKEWLLRNQG